MTTRDIDWLAGFLEGEGCFHSTDFDTRIIVCSTDRDVLERASMLLGSSVTIRKKPMDLERKQVYTTTACGSKASGWMMTLYSLMGERRKAKIKEILEGWRCSNARVGTGARFGHPVSENTRARIRAAHINKSRLPTKLTAEQVRLIRAKYKPFVVTRKQICEEYGLSASALGSILSRKTWGLLP
jgi:hypothetical protein